MELSLFHRFGLQVINLKLRCYQKISCFALFCKKDINLVSVPKILIHSKEDKDIPFALRKRTFETASDPKNFMNTVETHIKALIINPDVIITKVNENLK